MYRRNLFKSAAALAGAGALSAFSTAKAMDCKKRELQAIALCAIELPRKSSPTRPEKPVTNRWA